jgi:hypothetical protein
LGRQQHSCRREEASTIHQKSTRHFRLVHVF